MISNVKLSISTNDARRPVWNAETRMAPKRSEIQGNFRPKIVIIVFVSIVRTRCVAKSISLLRLRSTAKYPYDINLVSVIFYADRYFISSCLLPMRAVRSTSIWDFQLSPTSKYCPKNLRRTYAPRLYRTVPQILSFISQRYPKYKRFKVKVLETCGQHPYFLILQQNALFKQFLVYT